MALIYIFKWDFGQPVLSNLSKVGILNLGGSLTSRKSESDWKSIRSSILRALLIISSILFIFVDLLLTLHGWQIMVSLVFLLVTTQTLKLLHHKVYVLP